MVPRRCRCQQEPRLEIANSSRIANPQIWTMRALLHDFTAWIRDDVLPPPSVAPHISEGTLVPADQVRFPEIPANNYVVWNGPQPQPLELTAHCMS